MDATQQSAKVIKIDSKQSGPIPFSYQVRQAIDLYFSQLNGHEPSGLYAMVISEVEKPLLESALEHTNHNQTKAAKLLGLSRSTLRKKLELYGIS